MPNAMHASGRSSEFWLRNQQVKRPADNVMGVGQRALFVWILLLLTLIFLVIYLVSSAKPIKPQSSSNIAACPSILSHLGWRPRSGAVRLLHSAVDAGRLLLRHGRLALRATLQPLRCQRGRGLRFRDAEDEHPSSGLCRGYAFQSALTGNEP